MCAVVVNSSLPSNNNLLPDIIANYIDMVLASQIIIDLSDNNGLRFNLNEMKCTSFPFLKEKYQN